MRALSETERFTAASGWILFGLTALWAIFFVPMNMDEALNYHVLACVDHPFAYLNTFQEGCDDRYDIVTFFGFRIAGAWHYTGLLSSILYAPIYFLFHTPAAQYWFGLGFFIAFSVLLCRLTPKPLVSLPVILSFFPLAFQFIHDTGPVKFSLLAFPLGAMLMWRLAGARPHLRIAYACALALLVLLAIEDKIFFVYLLPSFAFFCLAFVDETEWPRFFACLRKAGWSLGVAALLIALGLLTLLFARMQHDTYLGHIQHMQTFINNKAEGGPEAVARTSLLLILAWPTYAHRVFDMGIANMAPILASLLLTVVFLIVCIVLAFRRKIFRPLQPRAWMLGASFIAGLSVFVGLGTVWAGHHFIFLWIPALVLFADFIAALTPAAFLGVTMSFYALSAFSILTLTQEPVAINVVREQEAVFNYFNDDRLAAQSIVHYSSWGGYFIEALYGPKNLLVTYQEPLDAATAQKLFDIAQLTHRRIYDVCLDPLQHTIFEGLQVHADGKAYATTCSKAFLDDRFEGKVSFEEIMPGLNTWHIFAATQAGK